ncbi:rhomboid family intramembrane serine protease [Halomarina salina]|uniref:Rhomboid family intramembrane serine protease n=1 Tax=Halomarina salina TaxID=1872699 RepID=A0ABD5RHG3_9EURY|nr:rhomboid family intramembrane serine protease [Halomarina salina]
MVAVPGMETLHVLGLLVTVLVSLAVVRSLSDGGVGPILRRRLLLGVPWGTLLVTAFVLCVYFFVQGGWEYPRRPMVVPFRAWSYFYPLGILTSPFAHAGLGHVTGNLFATLTLASLAEYAWGHYPRKRGVQTFTSSLTNPFGRIALFVVVTLAIGVLTGVFALGPAIGFSGVVFAFAGFALMRYPLATVVAVTASGVISLLYAAVQNPILQQGGRSAFITPWWASIAIQGHALGLFLGATLGILYVRRVEERPPAVRLFVGVLLFCVAQNLWAVYTPLNGGRYELYRAAGTALLFVLATLFASAVVHVDRSLLGRFDVGFNEATFALVLAVTVALAGVAIPFNLFAVANPDAGVTDANSIDVGDYTVFYAHDVPNQYISSVSIDSGAVSSEVNASGVIVVSEQREIWWVVTSSSRLANDGRSLVRVGGIGWRDAVVADYSGWSPVGNSTAYVVYLYHQDAARLAYVSEPSQAALTITERNVTVVPGPEFTLRVTRGGETLGEAAIPVGNNTTSAGDLTFVREDRRVVATTDDGTRVTVATRAHTS